MVTIADALVAAGLMAMFWFGWRGLLKRRRERRADAYDGFDRLI